MKIRLESEVLADLDRQVAASAGADLVLLPRPGRGNRDARDAAEASDGPFAQSVSAVAEHHRIAVMAGFVETCSSGVFHAALFCSSDGEMRCCYRQTHLSDQRSEDDLDHGQWLSLAPIDDWLMGLLIGPDLLHPEAARGLAVAGADALLMLDDGGIEKGALELLARARALENHVPVVVAGPALCGRADPRGFFEQAQEVVLDRDDRGHPMRQARLQRRRPPLYHAITQPNDNEPQLPL